MNELLRISVADDESDMRDYFRAILPRLGYEVVSVAENGRQLVEDCRSCHPDLVITDVRMPEMDGLEAATRIAAEFAVPVLLVSSQPDPQGAETTDGNGDGKDGAAVRQFVFLEKPINQRRLKAGIVDAIRHGNGGQ